MAGSKDLPPLTAPLFPNQFMRAQFCYKPVLPPQGTDLSGNVVIVTGSNTGLGLESSRQFLSYKLSRLIMAVRSLEKGNAAAAELRKAYPNAAIEVWKLDMSSPASVRAFAARVESDLPRLDIAVLNAGLAPLVQNLCPETGHEETIQVNYLSSMLLAILLLPVLKRKSPPGTPGRLVIVSSVMAATAELPDRHIKALLPYYSNFSKRPFSPGEQYASSKLLGLMYLWKLADYVPVKDVIVNAVEPGFTKGTELHRAASGAVRLGFIAFSKATARPVKDGATTILDAALNQGPNSHGSFLMNWAIRSFPPSMYTPKGQELIQRLWEDTMREPSFHDAPGILESMKKGSQL